jgi:hypothetical protein
MIVSFQGIREFGAQIKAKTINKQRIHAAYLAYQSFAISARPVTLYAD